MLFNVDIKTQHAVHYLIGDLIREKMNEVLLLNNVPRRNTLQHCKQNVTGAAEMTLCCCVFCVVYVCVSVRVHVENENIVH